MTYTEAIEQGESCSPRDVAREYAKCDNSMVPLAVEIAIADANWFNEQDLALRRLAILRETAEIRAWADEIAAEPDEANGWPQDFCDDIADQWRDVANAIDDCIADEKQWAREYVESHTDGDSLDDDDLDRAFRGMYEREPNDEDRQVGLWSLLCAGVA